MHRTAIMDGNKVLSPARLAHVVLKTPNFAAMVAFYKVFLGARASYENAMLSFLTYDDEHHRIAIAGIPGCRPGDNSMTTAGMEHVAFSYDSLADLAASYKQRKARGIVPVWCVNHGPTVSMYYQDPDGNKIELQVDVFATIAETNAFIESPAFAENPIGVDYDPDELVRRVESGEDPASIKKRPEVGPRGIDSVPVPPPPVIRESYDLPA